MKTYNIQQTDLTVSRLAYGCMNIGGAWDISAISDHTVTIAESAVMAALESGITLFDHADIYVFGKSEEVFGRMLKRHPGLREKIVIQSKCGIIFADPRQPYAVKRYDFSRDHIVNSVMGSLKRLQIDCLDILLLHRPDPLVEPEEVAAAFDDLHSRGCVRYFGVSNHNDEQIQLLADYVRQPLVINQVELNLARSWLINDGISGDASSTLEYCRRTKTLIQAWSPLAHGRLLGVTDPASANWKVSKLIADMAAEKNVSAEAIMLAWLLRHPAGIQPVFGTTRPDRIRQCAQADSITLSREEWYALFNAARGGDIP